MERDGIEGRGLIAGRAGRRWIAALALAALAGPAGADVITEWNTTATAVTCGSASPPGSSAYALMHAAIHDALSAVNGRDAPWAVDLKAPPGASEQAAAAAAAHEVLAVMVPAQKAAIDAALAASLSEIPDGKGKADGIAVGKRVAHRLLVRENLVPSPRARAHREEISPRPARPVHPAQRPAPPSDDYLPPMG